MSLRSGTTHVNLLEVYFRPKHWKGKGTIYEMMGVLVFKSLVVKLGRKLVRNPWKKNSYYLWKKNIAGIKAFERRTRYSELIHLVGALVPMGALLRGGNESAVQVIMLFALAINIHPILLQRYNRIRIYRVLGKVRKTCNAAS